jgi:hypothetical protein
MVANLHIVSEEAEEDDDRADESENLILNEKSKQHLTINDSENNESYSSE